METHADLQVDGKLPEPALHAAIKAACRALLSGWEGLTDDELAVNFVTGGISNALFKVAPSQQGGNLQPVVFRIYGDNTEAFIDREREMANMRLLHRHGFGPELLATFTNGRVEQFLHKRCLQPEEMASPAHAPAIAAALQRFHAVPAPGGPAAGAQPRTPFRRIQEWLDIAEQFVFEDAKKQAVFAANFDFPLLREELAALEAACAATASPVVFAHNDLLSGNVMVPLSTPALTDQATAAGAGSSDHNSCSSSHHQQQQQRGQPYASRPVPPLPASQAEAAEAAEAAAEAAAAAGSSGMTFIDFEYADWAPRGFDIGNHFCEYAGFDCDYSRYPGQEQAALFLRAYLAATGSSSTSSSTVPVSEEAVARCVAEANAFALAAHQYWGTWALLQAKWSSIDFDYLSYAKLRWDEYFRRKDEFISAAAAAFGDA